jgi:hypothetical protein
MVVLLGPAVDAANISIELDRGAFRVAGWDATVEPAEGWASVFSVYAGAGDVQPMLGSYQALDHVLTFHPRLLPESTITPFFAPLTPRLKHPSTALQSPPIR